MASRHRVQCIAKSDRQNPHERRQRIGGVNPNGTRWNVSESDAIVGMEQGNWSFFVQVGAATVDIVIASRDGREYLKTKSDGERPDNLLSLAQCPYGGSREYF
jgi:Protein of unknown function (DUF3892)